MRVRKQNQLFKREGTFISKGTAGLKIRYKKHDFYVADCGTRLKLFQEFRTISLFFFSFSFVFSLSFFFLLLFLSFSISFSFSDCFFFFFIFSLFFRISVSSVSHAVKVCHCPTAFVRLQKESKDYYWTLALLASIIPTVSAFFVSSHSIRVAHSILCRHFFHE